MRARCLIEDFWLMGAIHLTKALALPFKGGSSQRTFVADRRFKHEDADCVISALEDKNGACDH